MSLFKSASIVSPFTLLSRITGLVRELLIASTFGASAMTDAFNVAFRIPNLALVPVLSHAGLALAIGIGALINALCLLIGLIRRGSYRPAPGWVVFFAQVLGASLLLAAFLLWTAEHVNWLALKSVYLQRIGLLALVLSASAAIYFVALAVSGLKLRQLIRR